MHAQVLVTLEGALAYSRQARTQVSNAADHFWSALTSAGQGLAPVAQHLSAVGQYRHLLAIAWLLIGRSLRGLSHLRRQPDDVLVLR